MTRRLADAVNRLRHDKPARKVIKQARWLLLRTPQNLKTPEQQVHLQDLLEANQSRMTVYLMKAELKTLWTPSSAWAWRSAWKSGDSPLLGSFNTQKRRGAFAQILPSALAHAL